MYTQRVLTCETKPTQLQIMYSIKAKFYNSNSMYSCRPDFRIGVHLMILNAHIFATFATICISYTSKYTRTARVMNAPISMQINLVIRAQLCNQASNRDEQPFSSEDHSESSANASLGSSWGLCNVDESLIRIRHMLYHCEGQGRYMWDRYSLSKR